MARKQRSTFVTGEPSYWLRQRNGHPDGERVSAADAAMIAQRPGAEGDYLSPRGLVWTDVDPAGPGGFSYYTLTPIWEQPQGSGAGT